MTQISIITVCKLTTVITWHNIHMNYLLLFTLIIIAPQSLASEDPVQSLTPEELERYQFRNAPEKTEAVVSELNVGQQFILSNQRREFNNLLYRRLGIREAFGDRRDLSILQQLIDRKVLTSGQVREWQSMGIIFGDILAEEHGLSWVSYEDDRGVSKALRWRNTDNYVFPVTVFSKRVQYKEPVNAHKLYEKISAEVLRFKQLPAPVAAIRQSR